LTAASTVRTFSDFSLLTLALQLYCRVASGVVWQTGVGAHAPGDTVVELTSANLTRPYDAERFTEQLLVAGIPRASIEAQLGGDDDDRLRWLFDDVLREEVRIIAGQRLSRVVGIFLTDGVDLLVERSTELGKRGEAFKLGGQVPFNADPQEIAAIEIAEETPLRVRAEDLVSLGETIDVSDDSPKLPGVRARKVLFHYKCHVDSLDAVRPHLEAPFLGADGHEHDLLLVPLSSALDDERLKSAYRQALRQFHAEFVNDDYVG
jgi:hypothetical protein